MKKVTKKGKKVPGNWESAILKRKEKKAGFPNFTPKGDKKKGK